MEEEKVLFIKTKKIIPFGTRKSSNVVIIPTTWVEFLDLKDKFLSMELYEDKIVIRKKER